MLILLKENLCYPVRRDLRRILIKNSTWSHYLKAVYTSGLDQEGNQGGDVSLQR